MRLMISDGSDGIVVGTVTGGRDGFDTHPDILIHFLAYGHELFGVTV